MNLSRQSFVLLFFLFNLGGIIYPMSVNNTIPKEVLVACADGDLNVLSQYYQSGNIDFNMMDKQGVTPLLVATYFKKLEAVAFLLENGADPNIIVSYSQNSISRALFDNANYIGWFKAVLANPEKMTESLKVFKRTPLLLAIINKEKDLVELFLRFGADPNIGTVFTQELAQKIYGEPHCVMHDILDLLKIHGCAYLGGIECIGEENHAKGIRKAEIRCINDGVYLLDVNNNETYFLDDWCPISLEKFESGDKIVGLLPCRHVLSEEAFILYLESNNGGEIVCPLCRGVINGKMNMVVYK